MANLSARLIRFNGEIGPQYLDVNDKTGGIDGTMKPITKEMLQEMFVQNFPDLQNVSDTDVKAELELVKSEIQAVKNTLNSYFS